MHALYYNRLIRPFTQIMHKKSNTKSKAFLILQHSTLKATLVQYNNWPTGAGTHISIFESLHLQGSYVGRLPYYKIPLATRWRQDWKAGGAGRREVRTVSTRLPVRFPVSVPDPEGPCCLYHARNPLGSENGCSHPGICSMQFCLPVGALCPLHR